MTINDLAELIERTIAKKEDLQRLTAKVDGLEKKMADLATKEDLADLKAELKDEIGALRAEMNEEIAKVHKARGYGREIDELSSRLKRVEQKLGIK